MMAGIGRGMPIGRGMGMVPQERWVQVLVVLLVL